MPQQIILIHGGEVFDKYEEYLEHLKNKEVSLEKMNYKDWKRNLAESLGPDFQVIAPTMPNRQNARYLEWKIWFEKLLPLVSDPIILIGHSLGGIFLAKYLSENVCPKKIKAVFLVAASHNTKLEGIADFILTNDLSGLQNQVEKLVLYHSKDDPVVPYAELLEYQKTLPNAEYKIFDDRQHFNQSEFPEIISEIKSL